VTTLELLPLVELLMLELADEPEELKALLVTSDAGWAQPSPAAWGKKVTAR